MQLRTKALPISHAFKMCRVELHSRLPEIRFGLGARGPGPGARGTNGNGALRVFSSFVLKSCVMYGIIA